MKTELARKLLSGLSLWVLLFAMSSCSSKMDVDAAAAYFDESPAVTLYATCFFDEEQPNLKADFLGKDRHYYYKAYNYRVAGIGKFQLSDDSATGILLIEPANETAACQKYDAERKHTPHKAQVETKMPCYFRFEKMDGKWRLVELKSTKYIRTYWDKSGGYSNTKLDDLIELDLLRHKDSKSYQY